MTQPRQAGKSWLHQVYSVIRSREHLRAFRQGLHNTADGRIERLKGRRKLRRDDLLFVDAYLDAARMNMLVQLRRQIKADRMIFDEAGDL
jgi:hypothetical protein